MPADRAPRRGSKPRAAWEAVAAGTERLEVPGGWIYTHTVIRFGSVDKNFVADTFVPDSKDWVGDGAVIRNA